LPLLKVFIECFDIQLLLAIIIIIIIIQVWKLGSKSGSNNIISSLYVKIDLIYQLKCPKNIC